MEFITRRPITFPFFSPRGDAKPVAQLIKQQKSLNELIYYCSHDGNGKLDCRWVKACSL